MRTHSTCVPRSARPARRSRARTCIAALGVLLLVCAPLCRALCLDDLASHADVSAPMAGMPQMAAHADCHGADRAVDDGAIARGDCCPDHHVLGGHDRLDGAHAVLAPAPAAAILDAPLRTALAHSVRPRLETRSPGPPLHLLTLRFRE